MAFSESWVETDPDGAVITGSLLDDYQRQAKRALRERMEGDPANVNSGIYEVGTFATTAVVRAGTARVYAVAEAAVAGLTTQDGRLAITTDTRKLYHLKGTGAVEIAYMSSSGGAITGPILAANGSASAPSYAFANSTNAGMYRIGVDNIGIAVNSTKIIDLTASGASVVGTFSTSGHTTLGTTSGNVILPSGNLVFQSDGAWIVAGTTNFAIRNNANTQNNILIADAGAVTFRAGVSGITTLSIGGAFSGATTGAFSSNVTIGGTLGVTGASTLAATTIASNNGQPLIVNNSLTAANFRLVFTGQRAGSDRWHLGMDSSDHFVLTNPANSSGLITVNTSNGNTTFIGTITGVGYSGGAISGTTGSLSSTLAVTGNATFDGVLMTIRATNVSASTSVPGGEKGWQWENTSASGSAFFYCQNNIGSAIFGIAGTTFAGTSLRTANTTYLYGDTAGGLNLGATSASGDVRIYSRNALAVTFGASQLATFAGNLTVVRSDSGLNVTLTVGNNSNTAGSGAMLRVTNGGTSGGDPMVNWDSSTSSVWIMGVDTSDSHKLKITNNAAGNLDSNVRFSMTQAGALTLVNTLALSAGQVQVAAGEFFEWSGRSRIYSGSDGIVLFANNAVNGFSRIQLGGTTSSFAGIQRTGTGVEIVSADGSVNTNLWAAVITAFSGLVVSAGGLTVSAGGASITGAVVSSDNLTAGAGNRIHWNGRSAMVSPSDGVVTLYNNALGDFNRVQFGGTTNAFPALKRSGAGLLAYLADDSGYADFHAKSFTSQVGAITSATRVIAQSTTEATNTTDGAIQTDGGISVVKSAYIGVNLTVDGDTQLNGDFSHAGSLFGVFGASANQQTWTPSGNYAIDASAIQDLFQVFGFIT